MTSRLPLTSCSRNSASPVARSKEREPAEGSAPERQADISCARSTTPSSRHSSGHDTGRYGARHARQTRRGDPADERPAPWRTITGSVAATCPSCATGEPRPCMGTGRARERRPADDVAIGHPEHRTSEGKTLPVHDQDRLLQTEIVRATRPPRHGCIHGPRVGRSQRQRSHGKLLQPCYNVLHCRSRTTRRATGRIVAWIEKTYHHRRRRQRALGRQTSSNTNPIMTAPASQAA